MKIGIISDTHRNRAYLENVVDWLISSQHIASLYHLGDDYEDVVDLAERGIDIVQVPGIYHHKYQDGTIPAKQIEHVLGLRILLVHSFDKDVTREDKSKTDVILFGHTHKPEIRIEDGLLLMNPGHLKGEIDKQTPPSLGLLDIHNQTVSAKIFNTDFKEIKSMELVRSESGLYRS